MRNYIGRFLKDSKGKSTWKMFAFAIIVSFLFQLVCSKSSPMYPINDWGDVNCFFTIGKSLLEGKVLYRDIFDHKGPILYFAYVFASIISTSSFVGVFFLHVASIGLFLYFSALTINLITSDKLKTYLSMIFLALFVHTCRAFAHGGSAEELSIWFLASSLFLVTRAIQEDRLLFSKECLMIGLCAGIVLYIKFTFLGFYFGVAVFVLFYYAHHKKQRSLLIAIACFFLGIVLVTIPVLLYFSVNNALSDFFEIYFYNNIFIYGETKTQNFFLAIWERILLIAYGSAAAAYNNPHFALLIGFGWLWAYKNKHHFNGLFSLISMTGIFTLISTFLGKSYTYYSLIIAPLSVYGFCALPFTKHTNKNIHVIIPIILFSSLLGSYFLSDNIYLMKYEKKDLPQYKFAQKINTVKEPTLLYYGHLDGGFYHAANLLPTCKYFCKTNIGLPEIKQTHQTIIANGEVDFIVTRNEILDSEIYQCIDVSVFPFQGEEKTYYLYQLKKLIE